jgi:hypothetical protein
MVSFKFRLTEEEYFRFNYFTAWADPRRKRYRILYFLRVMLLYGAVAFLYILVTKSFLIWVDISVFVVTGLIYLALIPFFIRRSVKRRVDLILEKKENQHVLDESEIIVAETGITDKDTLSESRYDWDAIVHYTATSDAHYLYTNSYHAIVIPKRVIANTGEKEELERLLRSFLPLHA